MEEKYYFEILFQKLEEVKEEQKDYKILYITSALAGFFKTPVIISDIDNRLDNIFTFERDTEIAGFFHCRVLRPDWKDYSVVSHSSAPPFPAAYRKS